MTKRIISLLLAVLMFAALPALGAHEAGHLLAARALGVPVLRLDLMPFGASMAAKLSARGVDLPEGIITSERLAECLCG